MIGRMPRREHRAERRAFGLDNGVVGDFGNFAGGSVVAFPWHLGYRHLAKSLGDLAHAAKVIDVRVGKNDLFQLARARELLESSFEQVWIDGDALPRVEQNRTLRR